MSGATDKTRTSPLQPKTRRARGFAPALLDNRRACAGGVLGTLVSCAALIVGLTASSSAVATPEPPAPRVEFKPGEIIRLGPKAPEMEKVIVQATFAPEAASTNTVTRDETPADDDRPDRDSPVKRQPKAPKDPNAIKGDETKKGNNNHNDRETMKYLPGELFGSKNGWSDRVKQGDKWATAIMAQLNAMRVGTYAGQASGSSMKFRISVCKDGTIGKVRRKSSTGDKALDLAVINEVRRIKMPRMPAEVVGAMKRNCQELAYSFTWSPGSVK